MRTTFQKHTLADGTWHIDWLFELKPGEEARLPTFRLSGVPAAGESFDAELLAPHRRAYLDYVGEVSGNRGHVAPEATGRVVAARGWPDELDITIEIEHGLMRWVGRPVTEPVWRFEARALPD